MAVTLKRVEELRKAMLEGRENYGKFMKSHSRPLTEEEKKDDNLNTGVFTNLEGTAFEKYESHAEPFIIEFNSYEDAMEAKRVQDEMITTQRAFLSAYREYNATVENMGKQGAVISVAPIEVIYFDDDIEFGVKNHSAMLRVPKRFIRGSRDIMTLKSFVEDVYKAGFSDCADKLMNK